MKTILLLIAVVALGWLGAVSAIAFLIFLGSLVAWVVIILRSVPRKGNSKLTVRLEGLVEQEEA